MAWGTKCGATLRDVEDLRSTQEEADTKIILHALDASAQGATETGSSPRVINLKSIADVLGPPETAAVPAFHALAGADVTRSFSGKGTATCWDEFDNASTPILQALANLGCGEQPDDGTRSGVEQLVCRMCQPKTDIKTVKALRWSLFKKNQAESERLPPTQAILRAHYQLLVWNNDHVANPVLPSSEGYGWQDEDGKWVPIMTNPPPAPEAIIQLVRCKCAKSRCSNNCCQCQKAGLVCTDLCLCSEDCQNEYAESDDECDEDEVSKTFMTVYIK